MYGGMKNMAKTPMESEIAGSSGDEPVYPFGLSMTLGNEELEKLELDCYSEDCKVGAYLHISCLAEVVGVHKTDTGDGEKIVLNLQVSHMKIENEDEESDEEMSEAV